jgi:predicted acyl esterase
MRALLVAVLLASGVFAGCVAPGLTANSTPALVLPELPEGAVVETIEGGLRLVFDAAAFPFAQNVTIPPGTTIVRATAIVGEGEAVSVTMRHAETLRRRCNFAPVDAWDAGVLGKGSCSGVTLVDRLPDAWEVRATSSAVLSGIVHVDLLTAPLDGILAQLDLTQISMRDFESAETVVEKVESFDGTMLHVETTLPAGEGPWPTIISSSPYNHDDRLASGKPAMWSYFTHDWVERGYAVVNADVRGYGFSEGCVEVWGPNEQQDQVFLVEWAAKQRWSDGNVGFYGQSYVGTTPVEAAVDAPAPLKAIIAVAPVVDAYNDWHFGGVPNGENALSPVAYQTIGAGVPLGVPDVTDQAAMTYTLGRADNGFCDPTILARPNDPRAIYDAFYEERNFSARAGDVTAAVMYTEGFEDSNVKSAEIPDWFNAIQSPKLGLFGHWVHQHPTRADNEVLMLLWLDQHVKGKPVGFEKTPAARVLANDGSERVADAWPPIEPVLETLHLDVAGGALAPAAATGSARILLDSAGAGSVLGSLPVAPTSLTLESAPLAAPLRFGGQGVVSIAATLEHAQNAFVAAYLYEDTAEGSKLVTWGMYNLAHRGGHETYEPVQPGERVVVGIPLLPTEWAFAEGATLRLVLRGAAVGGDVVQPVEMGTLEVYAESALLLPLVDGAVPMPLSAMR